MGNNTWPTAGVDMARTNGQYEEGDNTARDNTDNKYKGKQDVCKHGSRCHNRCCPMPHPDGREPCPDGLQCRLSCCTMAHPEGRGHEEEAHKKKVRWAKVHNRQAEDEEPERRWEDGRLWTRAEFIDEHGELHGPKQWHRAGRVTAWCKHGDECPHYGCAHAHRRDIGPPTRQQHRVRRTRRSWHVESEEDGSEEDGSEEDGSEEDGSEEDEGSEANT